MIAASWCLRWFGSSGNANAYIVDPDSIRRPFDKIGQVNAVEATVGSVPFKPFKNLQNADFLAGLCSKALGQVEIVRQLRGRRGRRTSCQPAHQMP
jgi:hypothetical protein